MEAEDNSFPSSSIITSVLNKYDYLEQRDKAFIKLLFEGTVERRITLDFILDKRSSVKTAKMKPVIRNILRMGLYQLLFTDSPAYAVCKESVNLAGKRGFKGLGGFVNGVLRNVSREIEKLDLTQNERYLAFLPDKDQVDARKYLSLKYSIPEIIIDVFLKDRGDRTESILDSMMKTRDVSMRFRSDLSDEERQKAVRDIKNTGVTLRQNTDVPFVYQANNTGDIRKLPGFDEGLFNVQDVSSCKAVLALGIRKGDRVLDCCAAPGGKTVLASELAGPEGIVVSCDVSEAKTELIMENVERLNCSNVKVIVRDAAVTDADDKEKYDRVILDVPCSGLGILGKKRDIKYNLTEESLESLPLLQRRIIDGCIPYVKKGGRLVYSTCTIRHAENEEQVLYITDNHDMKVVDGPVQLLPDDAEQDGFFYCILEKK
ncbi:MAG: 16S rRNA (cytosine(967)-C(5))-methyltransferase RsmB [Lachnospiraceae bacterium]|nr:16S rRNA (cytosine(967)-C(5))-methyltransferase RsmB [Lachnospiraceae bacterium]